MKQTIEIKQDKLELRNSWGAQNVVTHATCVIIEESGHREIYSIQFERNQITGVLVNVTCLPRLSSTEHTLTCDAVSEICFDKLN